MTPSTCKSVLGVFVPVGIADNPTAVVDVTTRVHLRRIVAADVRTRRAKGGFFLGVNAIP